MTKVSSDLCLRVCQSISWNQRTWENQMHSEDQQVPVRMRRTHGSVQYVFLHASNLYEACCVYVSCSNSCVLAAYVVCSPRHVPFLFTFWKFARNFYVIFCAEGFFVAVFLRTKKNKLKENNNWNEIFLLWYYKVIDTYLINN